MIVPQRLAVVEPIAGNMSSPLDSAVALVVAEECLVTLAKVLDNILTETSYQKKTRKLKLTNATFDRRVVRHPGGVDFLMACQFSRKGQTLQLKLENENKVFLWRARLALHDRAHVLGFPLPCMPPEPAATTLISGNQEAQEAMSMYETSTICTLDELDAEIMKELGDEDISSSPITPVSPLGYSSVADRAIQDLSIDSPILSPVKRVESKPSPGKPPRAPQPVSLRKSQTQEDADLPETSRPTQTAPKTSVIIQAHQPPQSPAGTKTNPLQQPRTLKKKVEKLKKVPVVFEIGKESQVTPPDVTSAATSDTSKSAITVETPKSIPTSSIAQQKLQNQNPSSSLATNKEEKVMPAQMVDLDTGEEGWGDFDDEDDLLKEMEAELNDNIDGERITSSLSNNPTLLVDFSPRPSTGFELMDGLSPPSANKPVQHIRDATISEVSVAKTEDIGPARDTKVLDVNRSPATNSAPDHCVSPTPILPEVPAPIPVKSPVALPVDSNKPDNRVRVKDAAKVANNAQDRLPLGDKPATVANHGPETVSNKSDNQIKNEEERAGIPSKSERLESSDGKQEISPALSSPVLSSSLDEAQAAQPKAQVQMSERTKPPNGHTVHNDVKVDEAPINDFEEELFALLQKNQPVRKLSPREEEVEDVFGASVSSMDITEVENDYHGKLSPLDDNAKQRTASEQIIVNVRPPPLSKSQEALDEFFNGTESTASISNDSEDELPLRTDSPQGDHLEKEMASLLAQSSETPSSEQFPSRISKTGVQELDDSLHEVDSKLRLQEELYDDHSVAHKSIVDKIYDARVQKLDKGESVEDINYSSGNAHTDWMKLHQLMVQTSLTDEYEVCLGSLCTLSVVCSDLPTEELGIFSRGAASKRKARSRRSWLPLELVMGLWNLVLLSENVDSTRVAFVCSKLYEVLVGSQHLEILDKGEHGANLPHNNWVRVKKEKIVLLGFALPTSISHQSVWMKNLAQAIADDTQFWYGRFALPTIAIAGGDDEARAKALLRDTDFIQSRLDVIGIVTGTRRHICDCKSYVRKKKQAFKDKLFKSDEYRIETAEEAGNVVALDGCQQVATYLYRQGQVMSKSKVSSIHMLELATALHLIGMAVGEFNDWEMEMQIYQKTMKVLHECGAYSSECAADTLLSMGDCSLGQGDFSAAMGCYEEARDIYRNQLGQRSEKYATALHHVGVIHCEKGELETAMETFKTSLKIKQEGGLKEDYDENTADTLCWIGKVYREQGLPDKAKKYFDAARDVKEDTCGADSLEVAEILQNIAVLYDDSGDLDRSLRFYRRSLKLRRATLGDQHEDVCEIITCIGNVYKAMNDDKTALKVFRRASELRESVGKTNQLNKQQTKTLIMSYEDVVDILRRQHKTSETPEVEQDEIAAILLKMGHLYDTMGNHGKSDRCYDKALKLRLAMGDTAKAGQVLNVKGISFAKRQQYDEAMAAFERALLLRKEALGESHIDVGETLHNMGNCAAKSGDLNEARTYYDEALRIKRKQLGNTNTSVAQTLHNIGNVLVGQGSNEAAMRVYHEALTLRREVLGNEHVEVAFSLHCIAKINRKQHDVEAARENFNASLRIKRLKLRKNHPSIAETLEQLGSLYMEIGEEDEAALCLNGALNIYKAKHGEGVKVAQVYEQLGAKYERKETVGKAIVYFLKALRVRIRVFGEYNASVGDMHYRIGKLQRDEESYHEALSSFQAATKIRKKICGRDDIVISDILVDAGKLQIKLNQVDVADKCFAEALRIRNLILDPRHEKIGESLLLNGEVLVEAGNYFEAIETFREALSIFQDNSGEFGTLCADAYQHLALVYKLTEDYDKALDYYEKCLKVKKRLNVEDSLDVANVNHGLGEVYYAKGEYRRAEEYFRDSVEVMVTHLGEDHMDVAKTVLSLGRTCVKLNSPDEAIMYFEQAKLTKQQHLGDTHLEVAEINLEIGRAHAIKAEYTEAIQCFKSYLRALRAAVGDDVVVCDILCEIGNVEYDMKAYDDALKNLASALALYRVLLGDEHLKVANTLYSLGVVYEAKRCYKESMKYHKDAFRLRRRLLGPDDLDVAQSLDKISSLYMKQPNLEKALHSMKEALRIQSQQLGKEHIVVGTSLYGMGVIFSEINELEKAMECYNVSLQIRTSHFGEASIEVAQTLHNIGTVFGKQQNFESALDNWRRALVAYREAGLLDDDYLVAVTIGNINMAEAYLDDVKTKSM